MILKFIIPHFKSTVCLVAINKSKMIFLRFWLRTNIFYSELKISILNFN